MAENELIDTLCRATGLPYNTIRSEVQSLIKSRQLDEDKIEIEDLREILAEYLQDILLKLSESN